MPVMNGLEFLRQATARNEQLKKHFIFCTGNVRPEVSEVASSNRVPLLPKPFTIEQMFETLDKVLENSLYEGRVSFSDSISCVVLLS
jgi:CheY-like chemotaxis protein